MPLDDKNISDANNATDHGYAVGTQDDTFKRWSTIVWTNGRLPGVNSVSGASYTLLATDEGKLVIQTHSSAAVLTISNDSILTGIPVGAVLYLQRGGAGQITVTAGSGVTLQAAGRARFRVAGSVAMLIKTGANAWTLTGDTIA